MSGKNQQSKPAENNPNKQRPTTTTIANKPTDLSMLKLVKTKSATTVNPANMGASRKSSGPQVPSKTTTTTITDKSKLIKKAYVRFDDYLDLNEENMRRSCKRLMNHLYSESNSVAPPLAIVAAPSINACRSSSSSLVSPKTGAASLPIKPLPTKCKNISNKSLPPSLLQKQQQQQQPSGKGKSYLRSQYERRQLRQIELMQRGQISAEAEGSTPSTDGASASRQQQDLVVAKSHELSKRRFFEKLERRELIKNSNLLASGGNNNYRTYTAGDQAIKQEQMGAFEGPVSCSPFGDHLRHQVNQETSNRQKNLAAAANNDEIMLDVYESIASARINANSNNTNNENFDSTLAGFGKGDMPRQLAGAQVRADLTGKLIGFYTPSSNSPCCSAVVSGSGQPLEERLIEFSAARNQCCRECSATLVAANQSAFEIKVPAASSASVDRNDGFISSGLLVVKQVEVATELEGACGIEGTKHQQLLDLLGVEHQPDKSATAAAIALCGRHEERATSNSNTHSTTDQATTKSDNKTPKTPLELADEFEAKNNSKVNNRAARDANGSRTQARGDSNETMAKNSDDQKELPQPLTPSIASSDNQQQVAGVSSAISSSSSSGSNNSGNKMKKISSLEEEVDGKEAEQTTGQLDGLPGEALFSSSSKATKQGGEEEAKEASCEESQVNSRRPVWIEVSGASNRSENHEAPETVLLPIGQSGGAKESPLAVSTLDSANSAYPVQQTQSAAQVQPSLQTTITTKLPVRDVPPEANGINPMEAIVSAAKTDHPNALSAAAAKDNVGKVIVASKQVNEEQYEGLQPSSDGYANPAAFLNAGQFVENNVNHDVVKAGSAIEKEQEILSGGANIDLMGEDNHLIEPLRIVVQHVKEVQKSSSGNSHSINEEDGGSSCSSSGFGASVSVTSSLDGSNSLNDTIATTSGLIKRQQEGECRRPMSLALVSRRTNNALYDTVGIPRQSSTRSRPAKDYPGYKELVGPDQAYPSRGLAMLIENESYASVLNCAAKSLGGESAGGLDASIVLENDEGLLEGYANLPRSMASPVGYATVSAPIGEQVNNANKRSLENAPSEASSSSGHSYSTSSANSGGFSALPPAPVELECSSSNNFESLVSLYGENSQKKSLLKRFGSLVSKAFNGAASSTSTAASNTQSVTPKINEVPQANDCCEQRQQPDYNANNASAKSALVIEGDHQMVAVAASQGQVNEADLVILPTKSSGSINQQQQAPAKKLNFPQTNQHQFAHQNSTGVRLRSLHDDRLSRGKKHSRKLKQQRPDSSSVTFTSSTFSSSESSLNIRRFGSGGGGRRLKRADSLSEELESLMSRSTDDQPNNQRKSRDSRKFTQKRDLLASGRNEPLSLTSGRIDIDCISPTSKLKRDKLKLVPGEHPSESSDKTAGPRSLIRLFYPTTSSSSQRALNSADSPSKPQNNHSSSQRKVAVAEAMRERSERAQQPISGIWGFSSLIGYSHATANNLDSNILPVAKADKRAAMMRSKAKQKNSGNSDDNLDNEDQDSLVYSNLRPFATGYRIHPSSRKHAQDQFDKHQSLGLLHHDLLRKRNHRHGGHHHHHHHHHSNKHHSSSSASRHAHYLAPSAKCTQSCGQACHATSSSECCCDQTDTKGRPVVWGQLIKINKSDGSQVIELQRSPGESWGFFVARGSINNVKGIFISRMHDNVTSDSLTGLLSIGDRILAIDELTIEPDYDILRVNQMISKKSKILLKVKPFKG